MSGKSSFCDDEFRQQVRNILQRAIGWSLLGLSLSTLAYADCDRAAFKVALDIGHDKSRPGATSARGVTEYSYNHDLAEQLLKALQANGFQSSFLIGESGVLITLQSRPERAQQEGASLFISLHHDSVQPQYLSEWTSQGREHSYSDRYRGYSIFLSTKSVSLDGSIDFAALLGRALRGVGLTPSPHHAEHIPGENRELLDPDLGIYRFDQLAVLRLATMPAVLLEAGIIVNRDEEAAIISGQYHRKVVSAIVHAVLQFCEASQRKAN
jgi:N-acetylmuramoyl-L-alanine amidase